MRDAKMMPMGTLMAIRLKRLIHAYFSVDTALFEREGREASEDNAKKVFCRKSC